jgi:RimJ/RimL family protein N-acetyltransferase
MILRGSLVTLRPAEERDVRNVYRWLAQSDATPSMMGPPNYPDAPIPSWEQFCADDGPAFFDGSRQQVGRCFIIEVGGEAVGHVGYDGMDQDRGLAELDIWLRSEADCGRGYGRDALATLTQHLHETYGVTEFIMRPSARNQRALRAYARAGFAMLPMTLAQQVSLYGPADYHDAVVMHKRILPGQGRRNNPGE